MAMRLGSRLTPHLRHSLRTRCEVYQKLESHPVGTGLCIGTVNEVQHRFFCYRNNFEREQVECAMKNSLRDSQKLGGLYNCRSLWPSYNILSGKTFDHRVVTCPDFGDRTTENTSTTTFCLDGTRQAFRVSAIRAVGHRALPVQHCHSLCRQFPDKCGTIRKSVWHNDFLLPEFETHIFAASSIRTHSSISNSNEVAVKDTEEDDVQTEKDGVTALDTDDEVEEDDSSPVDKAEREYLEALEKGDVADGDIAQLDQLLGDAIPGDTTIGILYLKLGQEYDASGASPERILRCGENALKVFNEKTTDVKMEIGMCLHLIGTAHVRMEKFEKSLPILNQGLELLENIQGEQSKAVKCALRFLLGEALSGLGKPEKALQHLKIGLAEQEAILGVHHAQVGKSYRQIAEALTQLMKHEEALPLAKKAVEIHVKALGKDCQDEAIDRRLLAVIYIGLEEHEMALEQHKLVSKILAGTEHASQTVFVDIATADTEITLGKYDAAVASLKLAISKVEKGSPMHALALVNLAKVSDRLGKPEEAEKYSQSVLEILEKKVLASSEPLAVAEGYTELAALYEKMNKPDRAIELLKQAHAIYKPIPHQSNALAGTAAQIGMLFFFLGKVEEALPYLEDAVCILEEAVGEQNLALAMVLNHLGVANVELDRIGVATHHFERAKAIFDEVLGSDHDDTIAVARNLVNTYTLLDRLDVAIDYQQEIINEFKCREDLPEGTLEDAIRHLQMLEEQSEAISKEASTDSKPSFQCERVISD